MNEKIETYSPQITEQKPLKIDNSTTGFDDIIVDGVIHTKLNEKVIIQRIAKDLYKNSTSGLRELYNNSARACRITAKKYSDIDPEITVTLDEEQRSLVIEDNGIGISKDRFKQVLLELGTSDNLDETEVGQFGMGFASYTTLSSVVIIDTRTREDDQYKMVAKDGMSFQPIGDCTKEGFGTKLSMTLYPEVDIKSLAEIMDGLAKYSGVRTVLNLNNCDDIPYRMRHGIQELLQETFQSEAEKAHTKQDNLIRIDTEDFELVALVTGGHTSSNYSHIHLLGTPIDSSIRVPFSWWLLNIKDERKFQPMPDRDRMREESDKKLETSILIAIRKYFSSLDIRNYSDWLKSERKYEYLWLATHPDLAPISCQPDLYRLNNCDTRDVIYTGKSYGDVTIVTKLRENNDLVYQGYKNIGMGNKIKQFKPDSKLFTVKKTSKHDWRSDVEFLKTWGIPDGKQILLDNKVVIPKLQKIEFELIGHTHASYYEHGIVDLEAIDDNYIKIDNVPINDVLNFVKKYQNPYTFLRNAKELADYECRNFSEWLKDDIPNIVCATNKGAMTIKEIAEDKRKFAFCEDWIEDSKYLLEKDNRIIIYGTDQLLPMVFYLNPNCETEEYSSTPKTIVKHQDLDKFVKEKYFAFIYSDDEMKFFLKHLPDIHPSLHRLFANLMVSLSSGEDIKIKSAKKAGFLRRLYKTEPFKESDEVAHLVFYYEQSVLLGDGNQQWVNTLGGLRQRSKIAILDNNYLLARMVKEEMLPRIFKDVEFVRCVKTELNYGHEFEIVMKTSDKEFELKDDMKVLDYDLKFTGLKVKLEQGKSEITMNISIKA